MPIASKVTECFYRGLGFNSFHGTIPEAIAACSSAKILDLAGLYKISGTIPQVLEQFDRMTYFILPGMALSGVLSLLMAMN